MRTWFWLLLLANVILFALIQQGWRWQYESAERALLPALNEEKIRLVDDPGIVATAVPHAPAVTSPAAAQVPPPSPQTALPTPPAANKVNSATCLEWGDFSGENLRLAATALSALQLGDKLDKRQVEHIIGYWVYMPPLPSKAAVNQKIAQLKARGVEEYYVVQEGDAWRNAISLGVFKTEEAAQNFLKILRAKDVRSARVGARPGKQKATTFILREVDTITEAKLTSMQKGFSGSELRRIPCAH